MIHFFIMMHQLWMCSPLKAEGDYSPTILIILPGTTWYLVRLLNNFLNFVAG